MATTTMMVMNMTRRRKAPRGKGISEMSVFSSLFSSLGYNLCWFSPLPECFTGGRFDCPHLI